MSEPQEYLLRHFAKDWPTIERSAEHLPVIPFVAKVLDRNVHTLVDGLTTEQATQVAAIINDIAKRTALKAYTKGVRCGVTRAIEEYTRTRQEQL